jgi:hypothetical protein
MRERTQLKTSLGQVLLTCVVAFLSCDPGPTGPQGPTGMMGGAGPAGPIGPPAIVTPSINGVLPLNVVPGQSVDVLISGFATKFTVQSVVSFGSGIKVNSVKVASGTGLVANITVAADATPGARDVTVREMGVTLTYKTFEIKPYASIAVIGTPKQGALVKLEIKANDPMFQFSDSTKVTSPGGYAFSTTKSLSRTREILFAIQPNAELAGQPVTVTSGAYTQTFENVFTPEQNMIGDLPTVFPAMVPFGEMGATILMNVPSQPFGTSFTADAAAFLIWSPTAGYGPASLIGPKVTPPSAAGFLTLYDVTQTEPSTTLERGGLTRVNEMEPNDTPGMAQMVASLPFAIDNGFSSSDSDADYFSVPLPANAIGKKIKVALTAPNLLDGDVFITAKVGATTIIDDEEIFGSTFSVLSSPISSVGALEIRVTPWDTVFGSADYSLLITLQ